ncbi:DNA helicase RecQ [Methanomethylovorans sp.]|uniref:DNA helicase RecQ n=1 Tax=Methanomethylovorans sp. TaxID=2758717 RepID=UPI000A665A38|nr:DNA helicase RecQ [Methanomethylovorans sp.]
MHRTLSKYFGYDTFRPLQEDVIKDVMNGKDVFVLMPTGGGKSLCYQLPALLMKGVTVVVSPLISLMKDQVDTLRANGVEAAYLNSTLSYKESNRIKQELENDLIKLLYVAPERLTLSSTLSLLDRIKVSLFAIDESHCISEWGHDFRPEYRKLSILKRKYPQVPVIALTATATPKVREDTISQLHIQGCKTYIASFNRKNLLYQVRPKKDAYEQIIGFLRDRKDKSGIIYCQSRKTVDELTKKLRKSGFNALPYHAGLSDSARSRNQDIFIKDDAEIIVATIAFGMGIDKPNVRFVIHYDLPRNLESYYQETGRGGRDGLECECILFFSRGDKYKIDYFIDQIAKSEEREAARTKLKEVMDYCQSTVCRRRMLLRYFGEELQEENCKGCDVCLQPVKITDVTEEAKLLIKCVKEVDQRYGITHVTEILTGSNSKKIKEKRHHHLGSYATGTYLPKDRWADIARELVHQGILRLDGSRYPLLKLEKCSEQVIAGNRAVEMMQLASSNNPLLTLGKMATDQTKRSGTSDLVTVKEIGTEYVAKKQIGTNNRIDNELFSKLKDLRKKIANKEEVPPYIVFADTSLKQMATQMPLNEKELLEITGVGEYKLQKYGDMFLTEIKDHLKGTTKDNSERTSQATVATDNGTEDDKKEKVVRCIIGLREKFILLTREQLGAEISDEYIQEVWSGILPYEKMNR